MKEEASNTSKKKVILHISDMHMHEDCSLCKGQQMRNALERKIKEISSDYEIAYLLITGDIADTGRNIEYDLAEELLDAITNRASLAKANVIIVPGNHDIDRGLYSVITDTRKMPEESVIRQKKLEGFIAFYNRFYSEQIKSGEIEAFNSDKIVFCKPRPLTPSKKAILVPLNSSYSRDNQDCYIPMSANQLEIELEETLTESDKVFPILITHEFGLSTGSEYIDLVRMLNLVGIYSMVCGHLHDGFSSNYRIYNSEMRCLIGMQLQGRKKNDGLELGFFCYEVEEKKEYVLFNISKYKYTVGDKSGARYEKIDSTETPPFVLCGEIGSSKKGTESVSTSTPLEAAVPATEEENKRKAIKRNELVNRMMAENEVYITGHFHFGDGKRTHLFINLASVLGNYSWRMQLCDALIVEILNTKTANRVPDFETIIGYGMQGIVIGTYLASMKEFEDVRLTYIPQLDRKHDASEVKIDIKGSKSILIVTDVISTGDSISRVIEKYKSDFSETESLVIASIVHKTSSKEKGEIYESFFDRKIKVQPIKTVYISLGCIRDIPCIYPDDASNCPVYRDNLDEVRVLYEADNSADK